MSVKKNLLCKSKELTVHILTNGRFQVICYSFSTQLSKKQRFPSLTQSNCNHRVCWPWSWGLFAAKLLTTLKIIWVILAVDHIRVFLCWSNHLWQSLHGKLFFALQYYVHVYNFVPGFLSRSWEISKASIEALLIAIPIKYACTS